MLSSSAPGIDSAPASPGSGFSEDDLLARFFRAFGDPTRLHLLTLLLEREHTVSELVEALGAPQGRISTHLGCLRWCGLVTARREGRQMIYAVSDPRVRDLMRTAGAMLRDYAAGVASCGIIR
jgi:DNA-binding transcriptional ArsR family regulator